LHVQHVPKRYWKYLSEKKEAVWSALPLLPHKMVTFGFEKHIKTGQAAINASNILL
jgi:hypothetical protein